MASTKVLSTDTLQRLNEKARRGSYNRVLSPFLIERLDEDGTHVVTRHLLHNDEVIRTWLMIKTEDTDEPSVGELDMTIGEFNKLPVRELPA